MKTKKILASIITTSVFASVFPISKSVLAEVIMPEPIMHVTFDDGTASDITGRGNNGEVVGNPEFIEGVKGRSIHLVNSESVAGLTEEAEQYVDFGETDDLKFGEEDFSVAFWYKSDSNQKREGAILSNKDWRSGGNHGFNIGDMNQGINANFNIDGTGARSETDRFGSATDSEWHHVVVVVDRSNNMSLYIDGKEADGGAGYQSGSYKTNISGKQGSIDFGSFVLGADATKKHGVLDSYVDELQVYKNALTKEQIEELAKSDLVDTEPVPVLEVSFDDNNANDTSGNNIHGEVVGNPEFVDGVEGKAINLVNPEGIAASHVTAEQYVDFGMPEELQLGTEDFSIAFWYKSDGNDPEEVSVISNKNWSTGGNPGFAIGDMRNGMTLNFTANEGSRQDTSRITSATDNQWRHITATFNRTGNMILYVNGEEHASTNISKQKGKSIDVANFVLGADGMKRYGVKNSYVDELVVYKEVLNPDEVKNINAPYILKNKIKEYEKLGAESTASQEKKDKFLAVVNKIKVESEGVTDLDKIAQFNDELDKAFNEFSGPEKGIIEFQVFADTHVSSDDPNHPTSVIWADAINDVKEFSPDSSVIMNAGDFSGSGYENQVKGYYDILKTNGEDMNFLTALGNHDVRWMSGWDEPYERYMRYNKDYMGDTDGKVYYDKWIDGYHFIVINTEWDLKDRAYISKEQLRWLDKKLAEGYEDGKPVFLMLHQPLRETFWNSTEWDEGVQDFEIKEVLRKYPQTILFTGHLHNGLGKEDVIKTDYGIMVDVPGFKSNDAGDPRGQIGYHVTVYEDKVQLSMRDYKNDIWIPEHNYTIDLNPENYLNVKLLDVDFDDETVKDSSGKGNDGVINGDIEFVEGMNGGKAIKIENSPEVANKDVKAEEYVDFGKSINKELVDEDFSILFWYKSDITGVNGSIVSNKDLTSNENIGFSADLIGADSELGLNFNTEGNESSNTEKVLDIADGEWHQISATFDRDGYMTLYVDGYESKKVDITNHEGKDISEASLNFVLGADGNKKFGLSNGIIDQLKVYKSILGSAEIETVYNPYRIDVGETEATITWDEPVNESLEPAYLVLNGEKYVDIESGETSKTITGLNPNEEYTILLVNREKANKGNFKDAYPFEITTKSESSEIIIEAPRNLRATEVNKKNVTLAWDKPEATYGLEGYVIYKDGKKIKEINNPGELEITAGNLKRHTIYNFKVAAKYSNGEISTKDSLTLRTAR